MSASTLYLHVRDSIFTTIIGHFEVFVLFTDLVCDKILKCISVWQISRLLHLLCLCNYVTFNY